MLKKRMNLIKEENQQLLTQNAQLLQQLETIGFHMHQSNTKVRTKLQFHTIHYTTCHLTPKTKTTSSTSITKLHTYSFRQSWKVKSR